MAFRTASGEMNREGMSQARIDVGPIRRAGRVRRCRGGFTLLSLMVVMALIVVIAGMAMASYRNVGHARAGSGVARGPVPDARRHRPVLRRQEQVPLDTRVPRERRLPAGAASRIPSRSRRPRGRRFPRNPTRTIPSRSQASTTSAAVPIGCRCRARHTTSGERWRVHHSRQWGNVQCGNAEANAEGGNA